MLRFGLSVLNSPKVTSDVLAYWEIAAFFLKSVSAEALDLDVDEATDWYIDNEVEEASQDDYRSERQTAESEMIESFTQALTKATRERSSALGPHYPFLLDNTDLIRKDYSALSNVSLNYICLQFYRLVKAGLVEFYGQNSDDIKATRALFLRKFTKIFENIAAYAVAGHTSGSAFLTSSCRSSEHLHALLNSICASIGAGEVLAYDQWNELQQAANDGGVDCIVRVGSALDRGTAFLSLVGASIQEAHVDQKIMGVDARERFSKFFRQKPAAFQSAFARPQDETDLIRLKCIEKDCLLYAYEDIVLNIGKLQFPIHTVNLRKISVMSRRILNELKTASFVHNFEDNALI
ncbi:hypothetical protein GCM10007036_10000 [Alsobacter metallidurans]|uniref:Uncharacterized protein n=1 Tax=Alsobacter metallidurans TaxID=340221 RepID=A0A917I402_9HYPH|nr:hypothetical protein [Alsobacter metallidurans]GGH12299.1 hypothetical protein GCM10007036_10000 [Alsobacter metallidurans]